MSDAKANSPLKELIFSLGGVLLFLFMVLLIGISAWLRPAADKPATAADTAATTATATAQ